MEDHEEERVEHRAMKFAVSYYGKNRWNVTVVSHKGGKQSGYDLFLERGSEQRRVEVKGCTKLYAIPDFYGTEINPTTKQLVADELCVVCFLSDGNCKLAIIRREDILPENIVPKLGYRLRKFKNARVMKRFFVEIDGLPSCSPP